MKRRNLFNKAMAGTLAALAAIGFTACDSDQISYDGPDYVMFADSLQSVAIQDDETYHDIPVVATNTCDHDRTPMPSKSSTGRATPSRDCTTTWRPTPSPSRRAKGPDLSKYADTTAISKTRTPSG